MEQVLSRVRTGPPLSAIRHVSAVFKEKRPLCSISQKGHEKNTRSVQKINWNPETSRA